jgi:hypothetical protein
MDGVLLQDTTVVAPLPAQNELDAEGARTRAETAKRIVDAHEAGLSARRDIDLIAEKLLLHVDGSGDFQWADIWNGQRVDIPRIVSPYRKTENILRLCVDNAVAHHTTMPLHYYAEALADQRARERSIVDTVWMNHVVHAQDLNALFREALYAAMPAAFCPVHRYWRDEDIDLYEPLQNPTGMPEGALNMLQLEPRPGMLDCWVGNPFDTVFDRSARRGSVAWCSYGRTLPADLVRRAFSHIPGAEKLEGSTKIPSVAQFQRIAREWASTGVNVHGAPIIQHRRSHEGDEELLSLICREVAPGIEPDWPMGRLQLVAIPGNADLRRRKHTSQPVLLVDQPLPARDFSWTIFYSHHRGDDIHGKPWVEDLDNIQIELNLALSKRWEIALKMAESPIVTPGGALADDMIDMGGYNLIEVDPSLGTWRPRAIEWPYQILTALDKEVEDRRRAMYTAGGYQAVSRGEAPGSRMAYRAIVALQQADNSIHGPVNERFRRSAIEFAQGCWKQMKAYGDVPWLIDIVGDEYAYLAEPYIDNTRLSNRPPRYKLVNAFGASPELRAQEVLELMQMRGADGQVFLTTEEARRQYPNPMLFDTGGNPIIVARRRAKEVQQALLNGALRLREQTGVYDTSRVSPAVQQVAMELFMQMEALFPRLQDDDLASHLATLSEITQDERADPIARLAASQRQALYYKWQAMMNAQGAPARGVGQGAQSPQQDALAPRNVAQEQYPTGSGTMLQEQGGAAIAATAR